MKCPKCGKGGKYRFVEQKQTGKDGVLPRKTNTTKCKNCGYEGRE